ncbi:ArsR/SmtB family transcription factor [Geothrix fermentans]|jgi:DNA-binding transcriptional ArsR family regulator|uniref:ArsR/SmtB family transcription factor n=1 Tax=Geothrix fermentans TaxID=44676 RepID=UPI000416CA11|nr:metalloregulator ArsR/SmtB family transcription factor [Geothrix fermentans]
MRSLHHPGREQLDLPAVLYALSDPTRLEIVRRLAGDGELACGTFGLPATKATLSHHFKVLREAGIIQTRVEGVHRYNSLRKQDLDARFPGLLKAVLKASGPR